MAYSLPDIILHFVLSVISVVPIIMRSMGFVQTKSSHRQNNIEISTSYIALHIYAITYTAHVYIHIYNTI